MKARPRIKKRRMKREARRLKKDKVKAGHN